MEILVAHILSQKLDTVVEKLKCAEKLSIAFGFVLNDVEEGTGRFYYAHENKRLMEGSKPVATKEDWVKIKNVVSNIDVIKACTRERENTKWKFYKPTNVTAFAALLREVPIGCKDAVLPEPQKTSQLIF